METSLTLNISWQGTGNDRRPICTAAIRGVCTHSLSASGPRRSRNRFSSSPSDLASRSIAAWRTARNGSCKAGVEATTSASRVGPPPKSLVIAPEGLKRIDGDDGAWLRIPQETYKTPQSVRDALESLRYDWEQPENEDLIFLATDFSEDPLLEDNDLPLMMEAITGMRTVIGRDLRGGTVQEKIIEEGLTGIITGIEKDIVCLVDVVVGTCLQVVSGET